jgi:phospholipase C
MGASTIDVTGEIYKDIPFGLGARVPMLVVSPWTAGGFVNSQVFDHTSVLRFLETRFGVSAPNISPWRRAVTGDLTSVFDFSQSGTLGHYADGINGMKRADRQCKLPPPQWQSEALPRQEPGQKPVRALPYDFDVTGRLVAGGFTLDFVNSGQAGAAFRAETARGAGPWFFTVEAGKQLSYTLPRSGAYDFRLNGPNGFFRHFAGSDTDTVEATFASVTLTVHNGSASQVVLRNGYARNRTRKVGPGESVVLTIDLGKTANWYDITVEGDSGFVRQFAGHIENGQPSLSDPLLG